MTALKDSSEKDSNIKNIFNNKCLPEDENNDITTDKKVVEANETNSGSSINENFNIKRASPIKSSIEMKPVIKEKVNKKPSIAKENSSKVRESTAVSIRKSVVKTLRKTAIIVEQNPLVFMGYCLGICVIHIFAGLLMQNLRKVLVSYVKIQHKIFLSTLPIHPMSIVMIIFEMIGLIHIRPHIKELMKMKRNIACCAIIGFTNVISFVAQAEANTELPTAAMDVLKMGLPMVNLISLYIVGLEKFYKLDLFLTGCMLVASIIGESIIHSRREVVARETDTTKLIICLIWLLGYIVAETVKGVLTQRLLQDVSFTSLETLYYVNFSSMIVAIVLICCRDYTIFQDGNYNLFLDNWQLVLTWCIGGWIVNFITTELIRVTNSFIAKGVNIFRTILMILGEGYFLLFLVNVYNVDVSEDKKPIGRFPSLFSLEFYKTENGTRLVFYLIISLFFLKYVQLQSSRKKMKAQLDLLDIEDKGDEEKSSLIDIMDNEPQDIRLSLASIHADPLLLVGDKPITK